MDKINHYWLCWHKNSYNANMYTSLWSHRKSVSCHQNCWLLQPTNAHKQTSVRCWPTHYGCTNSNTSTTQITQSRKQRFDDYWTGPNKTGIYIKKDGCASLEKPTDLTLTTFTGYESRKVIDVSTHIAHAYICVHTISHTWCTHKACTYAFSTHHTMNHIHTNTNTRANLAAPFLYGACN